MSILKTYEEASGQEINLAKSEVFFSRNISKEAQEDLSRIMGVRHVLGTGNYLGLPSLIGRKKKETFSYIKDRIWKRINSWRGRALSKAGKEVMIKSVLQAIPSYVMSIYLLPDSTVKEIERMINSFWWGGGTNNKGIKWLAWDRMTVPKACGGMGFRDFHSFNLAMVAKQGWNIMTKPHTLVAQIYKARYFPKSSLFDAQLGHNPSYAWRGIWKSRHILMNGCRWIVGDGTKIRVMSDPWLREKDSVWVQSPQVQGAHDITVNDLMCPNIRAWDKNKIMSLFPMDVVNRIVDIPLIDVIGEDKLIWVDSVNGQYSVKSGYNMLLNVLGRKDRNFNEERWSSLWKIRAPPKAKHLLWRICKNCLPTRSRLQEKCVPCPLDCPLCEFNNEDDWHFLVSCNVSTEARIAAGLNEVITSRLRHIKTAADLILDVCRGEDTDVAGRFATLVWTLWNNRNNAVWNGDHERGTRLGVIAHQQWLDWRIMQNFQHISANNNTQQQQVVQWQKPPIGWFKCNTDASFHGNSNQTSAGWVLRDHMGRFVMAGTTWIQGKCSILEGEAIALHEAIKALEHRRFTHVIFESDSKNVVDAIHNLRFGNSEFSSVICNIRNALSLNQNFKVEFIRRQANMVAHTLARAAILWASRRIFDVLPLCITPLLNNEMI
jgi:ribonuclease HI